MIIFLNGAPSTGKSTIAREIMHLSERPFLYYSIDHLVNFWIDEKFVAFEDEPKAWFFHQHVQNKEALKPYTVEGPHTNQLHWDMIEALLVLIKKGYDLIIDEVLWSQEVLQRYSYALCHGKDVFLIKIICDLIECERREKLRDDRYIGLARSLYEHVYVEPPTYDLEVDTTSTPAKKCADHILQFIGSHKSHAFNEYLRGDIRFQRLSTEDFFLMTNWLNTPHVTKWWGEDKTWTFDEVESKYQTYVKGYKEERGKKKTIAGFIIYVASQPIGYIQAYNAYDFPRGYDIVNMPSSLASVDLFIGDPVYLGKGIGSAVIKKFLEEFVWKWFEYCILDPDPSNISAIRSYEKAGFKIVKRLNDPPCMWMIKKRGE